MEKGRSIESVIKRISLAQMMILKKIAKRNATKPVVEYFDYLDYGDSSGDFC